MKSQNNIKRFSVMLLLLAMLVLPAVATAEEPAQIWTTDIDGVPVTDYAPTDTIYIKGSGFNPDSVIIVRVEGPDGWFGLEPDGEPDVDIFSNETPYDYVPSWTFDEDGIFTIEYIKGWCEGTFYVTMWDEDLNLLAETMFTDATFYGTITTLDPISSPLTTNQAGVSFSGTIVSANASHPIPNGTYTNAIQLWYDNDDVGSYNINSGASASVIVTSGTGIGYFSGTFTAPSSADTYYFVAKYVGGIIQGEGGSRTEWTTSESGSREVTVNSAPTTYALTVATNPASIDSTTGSGTYAASTIVSISAPENSPIAAGSRYHFNGWSGTGVTFGDASSASTTVSMPAGATTVTANYVTQYYLTVTSAHGLPTTGQGWYDADGPAYAGLTNGTESISLGTQLAFDYWSGDASGSDYSQSDEITMDGPKEAIAVWVTQYYLTVNTNPAEVLTLDSLAVSGGGWYNQGANALVYAKQDVDKAAGERYDFRSWTGATLTGGNNNEAAVYNIQEPTAITANYQLQYELTLVTNPLGITTPTGGGWYDEEEDADISTDSPVIIGYDMYIFVGWMTDDMDEIANPAALDTTVYMDKAKTVTANYGLLPKSAITAGGCPFDVDKDDSNGQQFRLIFTQDPTNPSTYKMTASNPGQFFYNVFYVGTPGESATLYINVPEPFVTQGAMPVHIYQNVILDGDCFIPVDEIAVIPAQANNDPVYVIPVEEVPETGLVYVRIHLDYGLKKEVGYTKGGSSGNDALKSGANILDLTPYSFSFSDDTDPIDTQTIQNMNVFKHDPGFAGIVTDGDCNPIEGVDVQIRDSAKNLLAIVTTDEDGFYFFFYKHKGKAATYYITAEGITQSVTVKTNGLAAVDFQLE